MKPIPPIWIRSKITICPKIDQYVPVSTTTNPVTQVALVAVNNDVKGFVQDRLTLLKGVDNKNPPNRITIRKPNANILDVDNFLKVFFSVIAVIIYSFMKNIIPPISIILLYLKMLKFASSLPFKLNNKNVLIYYIWALNGKFKNMENVNVIPGNTQLVELKKIEQKFRINSKIFGKVENSNPTGSIKDRTVFNMLTEYIKKYGNLDNFTIVEATSGNTGISLAFFASVFNYKCVIVMPTSASVQRREIIANYGAELVLVQGGMKECNEKAKEIIDSTPNSFIFDQFNQESNWMAHIMTANELDEQNKDFQYIFAGIGTGGTATGLATYFQTLRPSVKVIGIEPEESPLLTKGFAGPHLIQGIGANFVPSILNTHILGDIVDVKGLEAIEMAKEIRSLEGIDVGISSGAALLGAIKYIKEKNISDDVVVIFPDRGDRYTW